MSQGSLWKTLFVNLLTITWKNKEYQAADSGVLDKVDQLRGYFFFLLERGEMIFLDFRKAFDTVNHKNL